MGICQFASPFFPCVESSKKLLSLSHSHRDISSHFANSCPEQIKKRYSTKWTYYSEVRVIQLKSLSWYNSNGLAPWDKEQFRVRTYSLHLIEKLVTCIFQQMQESGIPEWMERGLTGKTTFLIMTTGLTFNILVPFSHFP